MNNYVESTAPYLSKLLSTKTILLTTHQIPPICHTNIICFHTIIKHFSLRFLYNSKKKSVQEKQAINANKVKKLFTLISTESLRKTKRTALIPNKKNRTISTDIVLFFLSNTNLECITIGNN